MEKLEHELNFLENIGLMMTYKCQVACPHCIVEAGPHRVEEIDLEEACNWLRQVAAYKSGKIRGVSLTGGEPFYDLDRIRRITEFGSEAGLFMTAVTNAYWATTQAEALNVLKTLPAIKMLGISTDVYHQKFISFDHIKNAIRAAEKLSIPVQVSVCTDSKEDPAYQEIMRNLLQITDRDTIDTVITFSVGRAAKTLKPNYIRVAEPPVSACTAAGSPIIFPDGSVIACIGPLISLPSGHHLALGNLRVNSLEDIFERAQKNSLLHAIRIWGPHRLVELLEKREGTKLMDHYIEHTICDICYKLFSNNRIAEALSALAQDREFMNTIAYARVYYLKETDMLESLAHSVIDTPVCQRTPC